MSDTADLLRAIAALSWAVIGIVAVVLLFRILRSQKGPLTKFGIGPSGVTMEWAEAKLDEAASKADDETQRALGKVAKEAVIRRLQTHADLLAKARILWVDDHPENNLPLIELLREFKASIDTPRSNEEAFTLLRNSRYDVIISDVKRDNEGPGSDLKGVEFAQTVFDRWGQQVLLFTLRFDPARLPDASDEERLRLVKDVERSVFARTKWTDEGLHFIMDMLERVKVA